LQLPGFFGTEGAHQSQIASASASTNRQHEHITPNGDRQTAVSQCANASTCGQTRVEASLGQTRYWGAGPVQRRLPSPLTWVHVSSGNECGQPHGGQSRASRTAGVRAVFVRSVSTCPKVLRHGCVWWRFWWNRGPLFMPAEGSAYITHVRVHKSTCTRVRTIPGRMGWSYLLSALQHCAA
jgi:hypothetical protein